FPFSLSCLALHRHLPSFPTRRSSDLAVDQPTALGFGRAGRGGKHVGAGIGLAQSDAEAQFARGDARQDLLADLLLAVAQDDRPRSEEHTSELQSRVDLVCRLLLEKKN